MALNPKQLAGPGAVARVRAAPLLHGSVRVA